MKILQIQQATKTATGITSLDQAELVAIKQVVAQLKATCPGLGQLFQNPNNMTVLMKFFEIVGQNQNAINLIRNSMATIKKAMDKDSTTTIGFVGRI